MSHQLKPFSFFALPVAMVVALGLGSCGSPGEDVRVTLCKDMVRVRVGGTPDWSSTQVKTPGRQDAEVRLTYSGPAGAGTAICYYRYDAVEDTAMQLANPLTAYSTSPSKMLIDGQPLARQVLADTVKQAMLNQGKRFVDDVRNTLNR